MPDDDAELQAIRKRMLDELRANAEAREGGDAGGGEADAPAEGGGGGRDWPSGVEPLTDAEFQARVTEFPVALIDFWAPWCGPCRVLSPTIEKLAEEMKGQVAFFKVNVDENPRTAQQYRVQSIPTMVVFRNGNAVDGAVGALPKPQIAQMLRKHVQRRGSPGPRIRRE